MNKDQDTGTSEKDRYQIPNWVGKPPHGSHLDVSKGDQLLQKVMIDEKSAYYFGRNPTFCDIVTEHASCSRVHAVLLYHKILKRFALVDLESSHGTFVAGARIEPLKPVFLDFDNIFHVGASTRRYTLRPKMSTSNEDKMEINEEQDVLTNLPEKESELDSLTEYNTAQNRRIPIISITPEEARRKKRPRANVSFLDEEEVINPEDVDPTVGRFRNLVTTAVISNKRQKTDDVVDEFFNSLESETKRTRIVRPGKDEPEEIRRPIAAPFSSVLGGMSLNLAPNIDLYSKIPDASTAIKSGLHGDKDDSEPHKKKYAKEAWPGRKPAASGLY